MSSKYDAIYAVGRKYRQYLLDAGFTRDGGESGNPDIAEEDSIYKGGVFYGFRDALWEIGEIDAYRTDLKAACDAASSEDVRRREERLRSGGHFGQYALPTDDDQAVWW